MKCSTCGAPACWGFRYPGPWSKIPKGKRGYRWACDEHRAEAQARWSAATGQEAPE